MAQANGASSFTQNGAPSKFVNTEGEAGGLGLGADVSQVWNGPVRKEDKEVAINMLPNTDNHNCDGCGKDITGVSAPHKDPQALGELVCFGMSGFVSRDVVQEGCLL